MFCLFIYLFRLHWVLVAALRIFVATLGLLVAACLWDLVPRSGIEHGPPELGAWSLTHWTIREVPEFCLLHEARGVYFVNQECRC